MPTIQTSDGRPWAGRTKGVSVGVTLFATTVGLVAGIGIGLGLAKTPYFEPEAETPLAAAEREPTVEPTTELPVGDTESPARRVVIDDPKIDLEELRSALRGSDRQQIQEALRRVNEMGAEATAVGPEVRDLLSLPETRSQAATALGEIGPGFDSSLAILVELEGIADGLVRRALLDALAKVSPAKFDRYSEALEYELQAKRAESMLAVAQAELDSAKRFGDIDKVQASAAKIAKLSRESADYTRMANELVEALLGER